jgi:hypothetical protein
MKTTNYYNTFIEVAEDCPVPVAEVPSQSSPVLSAAAIQFEMVADFPYIYTSDDVIFRQRAAVYALICAWQALRVGRTLRP